MSEAVTCTAGWWGLNGNLLKVVLKGDIGAKEIFFRVEVEVNLVEWALPLLTHGKRDQAASEFQRNATFALRKARKTSSRVKEIYKCFSYRVSKSPVADFKVFSIRIVISKYSRREAVRYDLTFEPEADLPPTGTKGGDYRPINVRALDDYLGAMWCSLAIAHNINLSIFLPFDVAPDGYQYPDRACCGMAYMPCAYIHGDPHNGEMGPDRRIGYIHYGDDDSDIVFLGGEGFSTTWITKEEWANFHYHFVDVATGLDGENFAVMAHPEERRRQAGFAKSRRFFQPPGTTSSFATTASCSINNSSFSSVTAIMYQASKAEMPY